MLANQSGSYLGQPSSPVSILGIFFFLLGAPHIYSALQRRAQRPKPSVTAARYVLAAVLVSAIAGAVEISLF
jgi:hypothetical protein